MPAGPEIPDWADPRDLDPAVRSTLRGLDSRNAQRVAAHLVVAGSLVDDDPVQALAHARAARDRASRIAAVREAVGVAAYHAGDYAEASRELRAYRRMSGDEGYRAVLADCERALGRPEVALRLVREALDQGPDAEEITELRLVEAGARTDMGEVPAALLVLETAFGGRPRLETLDLADDDLHRLAAAYADLLSASGSPEAEHWQEAVAAADPEDEDVEFGEEELPLDESPLATSSEDDEDSEDSEDSGEELVEGDVLPADGEERVDTIVARIPLEDDLLDLPGTSDADIEAEVAELLGETDEDTAGDTAGGTER